MSKVYLLKAHDHDAFAQVVLANLDKTYDLTYVDYRDQLTDKQIAEWFAADTEDERWAVELSVYEIFDEQRYEYADEAIKEAVNAAAIDVWGLGNDYDADDFMMSDAVDEVRQEVWNRDKADPFKELLRRTPNQLMRCDLDFDVPSAWASDDDDRTESIEGMAERLGLDLDVNREKLEELFDNAGGGMLQVIWYADLEDLMRVDDNGKRPNRATFTDPYVIVIDTWNGAGHDVRVTGTVTVDLADVVIDSNGGGYGWDQIAGVVKSAYEPRDVTYHHPVSLIKRPVPTVGNEVQA